MRCDVVHVYLDGCIPSNRLKNDSIRGDDQENDRDVVLLQTQNKLTQNSVFGQSIWRSEQTGMVLTRRHLGAILNVPGYTKADLTAAWTTATYPELVRELIGLH